MKIKLLLSAAILFLTGIANATTLTVTAQGMTFTPATGTIHLGDTVLFVWVNGTHTTTSNSVPGSAASWDNPLDAGHTTFMYIPTQTGTYNYHCSFHVSMGMVGTFTVIAPAAVPNVTASALFKMSPNPSATSLHLQFNRSAPAVITITDVNGREVFKTSFNGISGDVNTTGLPGGLYFIKAQQGMQSNIERLVITH